MSFIIALGQSLVGAVFIWTCLIKAITPNGFREHLASLRIKSYRAQFAGVAIAAAAEAAIGVALILNLSPRLVIPLTLLALGLLSITSWWAVSSGRTADCGCYGGFIQPSIGQSLGINALLAILLVPALLIKRAPVVEPRLGYALLALCAVAVATLAAVTQRHEARSGEPLFDTNPLKVGRRWQNKWAGGITAGLSDEFLVCLMGPECPFCKQWVRIGNAMIQSQGLPDVVGVIAAPKARVDSFILENRIKFPVATISPGLMSRFTRAVPTTIQVRAGRIENIWVGSITPDLMIRLARANFPDAIRQKESFVQK